MSEQYRNCYDDMYEAKLKNTEYDLDVYIEALSFRIDVLKATIKRENRDLMNWIDYRRTDHSGFTELIKDSLEKLNTELNEAEAEYEIEVMVNG